MHRSLLPSLLAVSLLSACHSSDPADDECTGTVLFGRPNDKTGLGPDQCQPRCTCGGRTWEPPDYTEADADALLTWELSEPYPELTENPYASPAPPESDPDQVCAVVRESPSNKRYTLATFASEDAALAAGAIPTHFGACGLCSTLADLSVYMRQNDLTTPVRDCGLKHASHPPADGIACLQELGFTLPCAEIWYYNTVNTRSLCQQPCIETLTDPYHLPDGQLNECLVCDEVNSGPVFKAVAGRTRRNTGLPNAMCRPCSEVRPLVHDYD